jgi:hypothetical protein
MARAPVGPVQATMAEAIIGDRTATATTGIRTGAVVIGRTGAITIGKDKGARIQELGSQEATGSARLANCYLRLQGSFVVRLRFTKSGERCRFQSKLRNTQDLLTPGFWLLAPS